MPIADRDWHTKTIEVSTVFTRVLFFSCLPGLTPIAQNTNKVEGSLREMTFSSIDYHSNCGVTIDLP